MNPNDQLIFLVDDARDVLLFESMEEAAAYIEPMDIMLYEAYDSAGAILRASIEEVHGNERVVLHATTETRYFRLHELIQRYLKVLGAAQPDDSSQNLVELVARLVVAHNKKKKNRSSKSSKSSKSPKF